MDEVTIVKNAVTDAEWKEKIRQCQESALTVQEWCNKNHVNIKTYYYHLRRTREKIIEQIPVPICTTEQTINAVLRVLKC